MKLGLKEKIKAILEGYRANKQTQETAIRTMLEPYKMKGHRYTVDGLRQEIGEHMETIISDWKKYDTVLNQQVKTVIAEAKKSLLKAIGMTAKNRPADYATSISNAIQFVKIALEDADTVTVAAMDEELHSILKDFVDDYDTMKRFRKMVEQKYPGFIDANGDCNFPKTFGKLSKVANIMDTLEEMEAAAEMMFIYNRTDSNEVIRIQGVAFAIPMDGYSEMEDEATVENCAVILDGLAEEIDVEGQSETAGSGQKVDIEGGAE